MTTPKTEKETDPETPDIPPVDGESEAPEAGIGERIRSAREARGFTQSALALRTKMVDSTGKGVARTVLFGYESGKFRPGAREIRLICQALSITPNWLVMGLEVTSGQASMEAVIKRDWGSAVKLAMAISILKTHERGAFQSLVLSMAGRQLGDLKLSSLLMVGTMIANETQPRLREWFGEDVENGQSLESLMNICAEGMGTNLGNKLTLDDEDPDIVSGEWLYHDPKKVP